MQSVKHWAGREVMDGRTDGRTEGGEGRGLLLLMLLLLTERWEGCLGIKTARWELRHESMKCTTM